MPKYKIQDGRIRPYDLIQAGLPMILPSSGSMGNNGAITLTTALDATYANCYLYLPANAIEAGSAAGWYFAQMSSTTLGTVYNNTYTSGVPSIPASPAAFATTGPGAYTQSTATFVAALSTTLHGGIIGANGSIYFYPHLVMLTSGTTKSIEIRSGATAIATQGFTAAIHSAVPYFLRNKGAQNSNVTNGLVGFGSSGSVAAVHKTIDTSVDSTLTVNLSVAAATDYVILEGCLITINPGP